MLDAIKGLRALEEVEAARGQLYERLSDLYAGSDSASSLFGRLGLDQLSRRNVIQYQTRIVLKNSGVFRKMQLPQKEVSEIGDLVAAFGIREGRPTLSEAVHVATDLESRSLELYQGAFFTQLEAHFAPFVANLRRGCERHLEQLRRLPVDAPEGLPALEERREIHLPLVSDVGKLQRTVPPRMPEPGLLESMTLADGGLLLKVLELLEDGAYVVDTDRRVLYWNPAAARIAGFSHEEMVGSMCWDHGMCHIDEEGTPRCNDGCPLTVAFTGETTTSTRVYLLHRQGHRVPVNVVVHPIVGSEGRVRGALHIFRESVEVDLVKEGVAELEKLAYLDSLTGLANRRYIEQTVLSRLGELQRHGWPFGIIFVDIDNFKRVNDTLGHCAGDRVLRTMGKTLSANLRVSDLAGRWGGDEFLVVIAGQDQEQLQAAADKLKRLVERSEYGADGSATTISVSVGAVMARPDDTIENLLDRGDELMYRDKEQGRARTADGLAGVGAQLATAASDQQDFSWQVQEVQVSN